MALAAAVQFLVLLDFGLILPLAPDLVEPLGVSAASLGLLVAAYTGAAAISGLLAARVLDRFDRRRALVVAVIGLTLASVSGALATSFAALVCTRALAGICGAPTSALVMSLITDEVPALRRGRALGVVLSANAIAGVLGVPSCLWLAGVYGWRAAFSVIGAAGLIVALAVATSIRAQKREGPRVRPAETDPSPPPPAALRRLAHVLIFVGFASAFTLTANLSAYVQFNLGYPRADIPMIYMMGGVCAFVSMRLTGHAVDRRGAFVVGTLAITGLAAVVAAFLVFEPPLLPTELAFVLLLIVVGSRNVALRTLTSRVPDPATRGRFMSLQAAAQQLGAVVGVLLGIAILSDMPDGRLAGMPLLAGCSIALFAVIPLLLRAIERRLDMNGHG